MAEDEFDLTARMLIDALITAEELELVNERSRNPLAAGLARQLELQEETGEDVVATVRDWLLDQEAVVELYADDETLAALLKDSPD